jgi:putative heme-binding domain-containing protein
VRRAREPAARAYAEALARNPAIASQQESSYRTLFSGHPPEIFESVLLPAYVRAGEAMEAKKRQLPELAAKAAAQGRPAEGKKAFEQGKGTCLACHQIGGVGRALGPDLSKIGAIRTERDLIESIVFPSASLARDYETHLLEMADGRTVMGVIKGHSAEGLRVMDVAGQEQDLPHGLISASTQLPTSLMPLGLDQTMPEQELLDLVAWLRSLR